MHRLIPLTLLLAHATGFAAGEYKPDFTATAEVSKSLLAKDCPGVVKELNKGIKSKSPEILILAGSLFEEGVCVKPNPEQAAKYYMLADEAKHPRAMHRLIAMYAKDNRDPASALWWANKSSDAIPPPCATAPGLANDLDAFVATLNSWPKGQLAACVYTIGVYSRIMGLAEFPNNAALTGVFGKVKMRFVPAEATVSWTKEESGKIPVGGVVTAGETERWAFRNTIMKYLDDLSARTLKEYAKPPGIDPRWIVEAQFIFQFQ